MIIILKFLFFKLGNNILSIKVLTQNNKNIIKQI